MILVKIWNLPRTISPFHAKLEEMQNWVIRAIVEAGHGDQRDIVCLFPTDRFSPYSNDSTVVVEVSSASILNPELMECIGKAIDGFYHDMGLIRVFYYPADVRSF